MPGRNQKQTADYFSHDADASSDEKIVYLESLFGHTGYALYFKFLERMTRSEGFKIQWNEIKKGIYAKEFGISVTEIDRFITECCRQEIKAFIIENNLLFSPGLIARLTPLLEKREYNRQKYIEKKQIVSISETEKANSATELTQSKEKKSKEKNIYIYPDWLNLSLFNDFKKMRTKIKKPITTDRTIDGLLNKLKSIIDSGYPQEKVIQQSIDHCWQSFYEPKNGTSPAGQTNITDQYYKVAADMLKNEGKDACLYYCKKANIDHTKVRGWVP